MTVISGMACVRGGWVGWEGVGDSGGGWEVERELHLPLGYRQWYCVFSKGQIQAQSTG